MGLSVAPPLASREGLVGNICRQQRVENPQEVFNPPQLQENYGQVLAVKHGTFSRFFAAGSCLFQAAVVSAIDNPPDDMLNSLIISGKNAPVCQVDGSAGIVEIAVYILWSVQHPGDIPGILRFVRQAVDRSDNIIPIELRLSQQRRALGMPPLHQQFAHPMQSHVTDGVGVREITNTAYIALIRQVTDELAVKQASARIIGLL